ncbi:GNAT family N-acetyltransferase [Oceanobacillus bengalensis]|nr:GNAT family N-acetyltransferase [Oceanobacillus bengalensis]
MKITFEDIYTIGHVIAENELYRHIHYPEMLTRYDSNFIAFKRMPSLDAFVETVGFLRDFHLRNGQKHVKFYFPENEKLGTTLVDYLKKHNYETGFLELYAINPRDFPTLEINPDIVVQSVTEDTMKGYIDLQYKIDLQFGENFAKQKVDLNKKHFKDPAILQVIAFYKGEPAGCLDVIITADTVEIDGLEVLEMFRNKGIGSRLQRFVMERFPDKRVILVADGEDTPREMYQKQNYQFLGFQYEVQKIYND